MGIGQKIDLVAGQASRVLHGLRGPKVNTLDDLRHYLDHPPDVFFPEPPPLREVTLHESIVSRCLKATTVTWRSTHVPLSTAYAKLHETEYRCNQTAYARWLRPDRVQRKHALVYVHGWLEPGSWVEEALLFPRWLRELDVDIVHVSLPFHGPRNPKNALFSGEFFWTADLVRSLEGVRQAVHDSRSMIDYLRSRGYERVGVAGVSLGGSFTMLLACLSPLPDYVIPIVCHLRLHEAVERASILWRMKQDLERFGVDYEQRADIFRRLGLSEYHPKLPPHRQLWIEARDDAHIDPALVEDQWHAWGRPELHWISGGHMTFPLHLREMTAAMHSFMARLD